MAMEGPSEATVQCVDNQDGSCTVDYIPTEEGDYDVTIKFGDQHIPGSPFRVRSTKIICYRSISITLIIIKII